METETVVTGFKKGDIVKSAKYGDVYQVLTRGKCPLVQRLHKGQPIGNSERIKLVESFANISGGFFIGYKSEQLSYILVFRIQKG